MPVALLVVVMLVPAADPRSDEQDDRIVVQLARVATDTRARHFSRLEALRTLARIGPKAKAAVPILAEELARFRAGESLTLQEAMIATLGKIGPAARSAVPMLTQAAGQDIDVDRAVRLAIGQILASPESLEIQDLVKQLRSGDVSIRIRAAKALVRKGPRADVAIPDLLALLQDTDADARHVAIEAIRAIQPDLRQLEPIVQAYILDLNEADDAVRLSAAKMLGRLGPAAAPAVQALQKLQSDPDPDVRRVAGETLGKIGGP